MNEFWRVKLAKERANYRLATEELVMCLSCISCKKGYCKRLDFEFLSTKFENHNWRNDAIKNVCDFHSQE